MTDLALDADRVVARFQDGCTIHITGAPTAPTFALRSADGVLLARACRGDWHAVGRVPIAHLDMLVRLSECDECSCPMSMRERGEHSGTCPAGRA